MRSVILLIMIAGVTLVSCRRSNDSDIVPIEGTWRMIQVKDNSSGIEINKPSSITGDVEITFRHTTGTNGIYNGHTPTNTIVDNNFSLAGNRRITIASLGMTQVMESQWGLYFVDNIVFSKEYEILFGNKLQIKTSTFTLVFERI